MPVEHRSKSYGNAVVILSGGMDSTTLLYWMVQEARVVHALSFDYGQKHGVELHHAANICELAGVPHEVVDLVGIRDCLRGSALTDEGVKVPDGHYEEASMMATVVPNRNMILLSVAAAYCISYDMETLAYASHSGDHAIYPDCRPEFVQAMGRVLKLCHYDEVQLASPFQGMTKPDIVKLGMDLMVPYELTYSCYKGLFDIGGKPYHCGTCGTCTERREAFLLAGAVDPTRYVGQ